MGLGVLSGLLAATGGAAAQTPAATPAEPNRDMTTPDLPAATKLAVERPRLACERTLMAWIRTAASLISFGFTIYKFFDYLKDSNQARRAAARVRAARVRVVDDFDRRLRAHPRGNRASSQPGISARSVWRRAVLHRHGRGHGRRSTRSRGIGGGDVQTLKDWHG
jgi:hypothetical protein